MRIITSSEQAKAIPGYLIDGFDSDDLRRIASNGQSPAKEKVICSQAPSTTRDSCLSPELYLRSLAV